MISSDEDGAEVQPSRPVPKATYAVQNQDTGSTSHGADPIIMDISDSPPSDHDQHGQEGAARDLSSPGEDSMPEVAIEMGHLTVGGDSEREESQRPAPSTSTNIRLLDSYSF